jgi:hypothetical protein
MTLPKTKSVLVVTGVFIVLLGTQENTTTKRLPSRFCRSNEIPSGQEVEHVREIELLSTTDHPVIFRLIGLPLHPLPIAPIFPSHGQRLF